MIQWLFLVPLKGGIGGIVHPPIGSTSIYHLYTTFLSLPYLGDEKCYLQYHLLGEPETTTIE